MIQILSLWLSAIEIETKIALLNRRKVFSAVIPTPRGVSPVRYKWVFVRKRNENNELIRYKARIVAQGFTQRPGIDFIKTYSPEMNSIMFLYLISMVVQNCLSKQLMDVVTTYLYGSLDSDIYMKVPNGISIPNPNANRNMYCIKLQKSLYGLKRSGRMWYNRLSWRDTRIMMTAHASSLKNHEQDFCIILVYFDDLNIIGNETDINEAHHHLKT